MDDLDRLKKNAGLLREGPTYEKVGNVVVVETSAGSILLSNTNTPSQVTVIEPDELQAVIQKLMALSRRDRV